MRPAALALVLVASAAAAHTGIAQSLSVTLRPGGDDEVLVSTTFGAVITRDHGQSWRAICEEAIGSSLSPAWLLSASGAIFAGSIKGLAVARTDGCDWEAVAGFETTGCSDLQAQGATLLAASAKYGVENRILRSTDDGLSWTASPERSSELFYSSLRIAPSNPDRVYAAGWWFAPFTSILLRSDDNGRTFTRTDLSAALPAAGAFYVLAVHPLKPEVLFASVVRDAEPRLGWLLKSTDSGATFKPVLSSPEGFGSAAFGADPATIYAASGNTLYRSTDEGESFTALPTPQKNACVTTHRGRVYGCGLQELDGWAVGESDGGAFAPLLKWGQIAGPLSCPAGSAVNTLCEPLWLAVLVTFPPEGDAGVPASDGGTPPPVPKSGCGCTTLAGPLWLAALLWLRRAPRRAKVDPTDLWG